MPAVAVLGIDPGSRRCGYGVVARQGTLLARIDSGVLVPGDLLPMPERLARIFDGLSDIVARHGVEAVAVETAYCGRSARSALALGQARGVALSVAARAGLPVFEYAPAEVKRAFTGSGRAEKSQMIRTARTLFGREAELSDEADALAIAVCHLARVPARLPGVARDRSGPSPSRGATLRSSIRRFGGLP
jgi:crossover junction endodeoxyribonuclease RuvC